jgi:hypothetical protein
MAPEILTIGTPTLAERKGALIYSGWMTDFRQHMDHRFDRFGAHLNARFGALDRMFVERRIRTEQEFQIK